MNTKAFQKINYGMYIVSSAKEGKFNGQIANTVFQVTAEPCTIAVSINKLNYTHEFITSGKAFSVSALSREATMPFIGQFGFKSGRSIDKFANVKHRIGGTGVPIVLDYAVAFFEAEVIASFDCGTHTLFLGKVVDADILEDAEGMSYSYYHTIKGGLTQKNAPTYIKP
jgi:flavin reductase (DIM6/NTAB) family NADH-FMN oxidoreductase RutF